MTIDNYLAQLDHFAVNISFAECLLITKCGWLGWTKVYVLQLL